MRPKYLSLSEKEFKRKIEGLYDILNSCELCGWKCNIDRIKGEKGKCNAGFELKISSAMPHFGEESPLVGEHGSGTIFFSHCSLSCVYCQNWQISQEGSGQERSPEEVARMMMKLQEKGCHNINWVTPTHYVPQLVKSLKIAKEKGLEIPIVYNTGGYDSLKTLKLLDGVIDIYMPDMKYGSNAMAQKYSGIPNYWDVNKRAVKEMYQQVGGLEINEQGIAERGLLIRHLVLPDEISNSKEVLRFIADEVSKAHVNIMEQYRPCHKASEYGELSQRVPNKEYRKVIEKARDLGIKTQKQF